MAKSEKITIEKLAGMVQRNFNNAEKKTETSFKGIEKRLDGVNKRFDDMDKRFDKIENILLQRHEDEIKYLKERLRVVENALNIE